MAFRDFDHALCEFSVNFFFFKVLFLFITDVINYVEQQMGYIQ